MSNYLCDVLRIHTSSRADLIAKLRSRQWGMAEDSYNRIIAKTLCGNTVEFWPRINSNIALRDKLLSNSGGNTGIRVTNEGFVGINISTPFFPLHIKADSTDYCIMMESKSSSIKYGMIKVTDVTDNTVDFYRNNFKLLSLAVCGSSNEVKLYADINSDAWQIFSGCVVGGLEPGSIVKYVHYKKVGNLVFVYFTITGTSTTPGGTHVTFTLPYKGCQNLPGRFIMNFIHDSVLEIGSVIFDSIHSGQEVHFCRGTGTLPMDQGVHVRGDGMFFYEAE